jgi:hypothetical protein
MSIFRSKTVTCPGCEESLSMEAAESVNADRREDLRSAILDGSFQVETCPKCDKKLRLDPLLNYLDVGRGQWISAQPLESLPEWVENEDEAIAVFSKAYGAEAPASAREIGAGLRPRLVFGWAALREKIVAAENQIDDVALELLKLALIEGLGNVPLAAGNELRLESADSDGLDMNWINAQTEAIVEPMRVPRSMLDEIVKDQAAWASVRESLDSGPFIDMQKLYLGQGRTVAA